ncbi:hypothetical protein BJ085DRAFT_33424 [Dimargaris cristalligena]|uniref:Uncharacterized protein n=1 Tax=Dimargaris cristalligena TaxID=215637 RepID=A0A4P9ZL42_9FUNG|nr:hypothetical protein BJ085DRAFT_33424 [Dimargaris cristalligena]|eukprot:RKP33843.1 hypothetical protein BJ085DRAFT_33424 [Dimargaris cristalligena]
MTTLAIAGVGQLNTKAYPVSTPDSPAPETAADNTSVSRDSLSSMVRIIRQFSKLRHSTQTVDPEVSMSWGDMNLLTEEQPDTACEAINQSLHNVLDASKGRFGALKSDPSASRIANIFFVG